MDLESHARLSEHIRQAEAYMVDGNFRSAIAIWNLIKITYPVYSHGVHLSLADCLLAQLRFDAAEQELRICLEKRPGDPAALASLQNLVRSKNKRFRFVKTRISGDDNCCVDSDFGVDTPLNVEKFVLWGWVLIPPEVESTLILEFKDGTSEEHALTVLRPDVVNHFGAQDIACAPCCGFNVVVDLSRLSHLVVRSAGFTKWLYEFTVRPALQFIRGKDDWLFLDADSNRSVEQFLGKELLSDAASDNWRIFFQDLSELAQHSRTCFLIAPNKEAVLQEMYPHQRAAVTVVDQVLALAPGALAGLVYPLEQLRTVAQPYYKTDTHWTHGGALRVANEVLAAFGRAERLDDYFEFREAEFSGDIGGTLVPKESEIVAMAVAKAHPGAVVFRSHTEHRNAGRVLIYHNEHPVIDGKLVIFGSSSADSLAFLFARMFREVVFFYSPASPCREVLTVERPDYILLQTSERFLIKPPVFTDRLSESGLHATLGALSQPDRNATLAKIGRETNQTNVFYQFMVEQLSAQPNP